MAILGMYSLLIKFSPCNKIMSLLRAKEHTTLARGASVASQ